MLGPPPGDRMAQPLKNHYDRAYVTRLAGVLASCSRAAGSEPPFDEGAFVGAVFAEGWDALALLARNVRISEAMRACLPADYLAALSIVRAAGAAFDGSMALFFPDFVGRFGLEAWEASVAALHWLTRFGTSELAVRPFLKADAPRMLATMAAWTTDENEHVRRLASEGCRPRLPWAMGLPAFVADPTPLLPLLTALRDDESEYVRRSVANNLNDIAKDHPALVLEIAHDWHGRSPDVDRLVKHACRTLLKAGDARAMRLFGFQDPSDVEVTDLRVEEGVVPRGGDVAFRFALRRAGGLGKLRLEYAIEFARPRGRTGRKIFKISESTSDETSREVRRRHSLVDRSIRKHYPGPHRITLVINGTPKGSADFELEG